MPGGSFREESVRKYESAGKGVTLKFQNTTGTLRSRFREKQVLAFM